MIKSKNKILFNIDEGIGKLSPHMFGANLEHIGEAIYKNGVWAEVIENRKFCGADKFTWETGVAHDHLDFGIIKPWQGFNPSAKHVMYAHSNSEFVVKGEEQINRFGSGKQSQQITIREKSEKNRGIKQPINVNFVDEAHQFSIMLKGTGQKVYIQIGELNFVIKSRSKWFEFKKNIKFNDLKTKKTLSISINSDELFIANCSLKPKNTNFGFRKDITKLIKEWVPSYLRWPGGNYLSGYNWINGIGDKNYRLPFYDYAWYEWENNDVGTDEFMQWCEYIGSEPMITMNTGNGTPEEAASWIEYITGSTKTKYGKLRAKNGRVKPYDLKTIFIGNEMFGGWQIGHTDAKTYALKYNKFVRAIKKVNPNLRYIAVGACADHFGHWNEIVLKNISERVDELSVHYYSIRTEKDKTHPHYTSRYIPTVAASTEVEIMLDKTIAEIKKYTKKNITIAFDEWNTYVEAEHPNYIENYNISDALYAGSLLNACINRGDMITNTGVYHLINVMGNYRIDGQKIWKTPTTLVLELFTKYHKGEILKTSVSSPTFSSPALGKQPVYKNNKLIDASATYDQNQVCLSIVNKSEKESLIVSIPQHKKIIANYLVNGSSPTDLNDKKNLNKITIKKNQLECGEDFVEIPPHSFSLILMKV
ncbi:MAG: alpha-L-arabinofuranosidase C-terminal domain-containing protein [Flavobacteriales bacterium]|tara:strand:- start:273 stop:2216 length:1944 start_codon:yes stop_codon:yes gene_type:complete